MRLTKHLLLLASLLPVAACGGGGAADDDDDSCTVEVARAGADNTFVVNTANIPPTPGDALKPEYALDVDGADEAQPLDNQLGSTIATLSSQFGLDVAAAVNGEIAKGTVILLVNVDGDDISENACAGANLYLGANPNPAACTSPEDTVCGGHLQGGASFEIAANNPTNDTVVGSIIGGAFSSDALGTDQRKVTLELAIISGQDPVVLDIYGTSTTFSVGADGVMSGVLAGAVKQSDVQTNVLPVVKGVIDGLLANDCAAPVPPDMCCTADTTGAMIMSIFDADMDCVVSLEEIQNNGIIRSALSPDVDFFDANDAFAPNSDATNDSISVGLGFTAVTATFTP